MAARDVGTPEVAAQAPDAPRLRGEPPADEGANGPAGGTPSAPPKDDSPAQRARLSRRKALRLGALAAIVVAGGGAGAWYWRQSTLYASTDNAYVGADTVTIAAQVAGPVTAVHVRDNQRVGAGDPLFDIDPRPFELALSKARAQLELARQGESQESAAVAAARAQLAQRQAELENARSNERRTTALVASGFLSQQGGETARTQRATAEAAVRAAEAAVRQAESAHGASGEANAAVQSATAAVAQAELDLARTHVTAPAAGVVANLTLRPGDMVQPGVPLFALISDREFWVDANFKETELARIRPGQDATIELDMYPDRPFRGRVESVSGGSGSAFSLLPPQNATGNWVKVTQRVPVRVRVLDPDPARPLRIGTTATVRVRTG